MDVKSAFNNGFLEEEVFLNQPPGYLKVGEEKKVCRLKKALYGLKQAPRAWYSRIDGYFLRNKFQRCPFEHTLYIKEGTHGEYLIVCLYVDDFLFTGTSSRMCEEFKRAMMHEFEMTDMGLLHFFLGIEVKQQKDGIWICQKKYAKDALKKFRMEGATPTSTPMEVGLKLSKFDNEEDVDGTLYRSLIGSLMYLTATRPDLTFSVCMLSRFMESPKISHWEAGKRVLRYLCGTVTEGIFYRKVEDSSLVGYCDSDWGGSVDDSKSTSAYVFNGVSVDPLATVKRAEVAYGEYSGVLNSQQVPMDNPQTVVRTSRFLAPDQGKFKINCDTAIYTGGREAKMAAEELKS